VNPKKVIPTRLKRGLRLWFKAARKIFLGEYGLPDVLNSSATSFSQFGEDILLSQLLWSRKTGFYVDVGAFDPYVLSNTCLFYRKGWRGINIEPNPEALRRFKKHRPRDINLELAVTDREHNVQFSCDGVFSGIRDSNYIFSSTHAKSQQIVVCAKPLSIILSQHLPPGQSIDFLTVDCEGHDATVLNSNDWSQFRPLVVLAEDHEKNAGLTPQDILFGHGYRLYCRLRLTKVFVREDFVPT
jgi:FkbM family methyltransferase